MIGVVGIISGTCMEGCMENCIIWEYHKQMGGKVWIDEKNNIVETESEAYNIVIADSKLKVTDVTGFNQLSKK
jgi:hypothetical protein